MFSFGNGDDLPIGIHSASLVDVISILGTGSLRRSFLAGRLKNIYELVLETSQLRRFVLFGSFVTRKIEPNDIDIFLIMENAFDVKTVKDATRGLFEHATAQAEWDASIFWIRLAALFTSEDEFIAYWQIRRDGGLRGIVEIVSE